MIIKIAIYSMCLFSHIYAKFEDQIVTLELPHKKISQFLILDNTTDKELAVTLFYKKSGLGSSFTYEPIPKTEGGIVTLAPHRITELVLPEYHWFEKRGTGLGVNKLLNVLMHSKVIGFSITRNNKCSTSPQILLKEKNNVSTYTIKNKVTSKK